MDTGQIISVRFGVEIITGTITIVTPYSITLLVDQDAPIMAGREVTVGRSQL